MKKKLLVMSLLTVALTACGGNPVVHTKHKDVKIYSTKFYENGSWVTKSGLSWSESYDALVAQTKLTSGAVRDEYLHLAEDLLMETGAISPLYYYTDLFLESKSLKGYYSSPLGYKFFQGCDLDGTTEFKVCVGPKADSYDPALNSAVDGAITISHVFEGLYRWKAPEVGDVATELELGQAKSAVKVTNSDGTVTWTFTLKEGLTFSDGTPLKATDFKKSWERAASGKLAADYGYMFDCIKGYEECAADETGATGISGVVADDAAGTLKVTINSDLPYFMELTAFPTYAPVKLSELEGHESDWWFYENGAHYIGNGPMKVSAIDNQDGGKVEFVKNDKYWDADSVVATKITFGLLDDDQTIYNGFNDKTFCFVDSLPNGEIDNEKAKPEDQKTLHINGQLGTYYVIFNVNDETFDAKVPEEANKAKIRKALGLFLDRNYICTNIGKAGQEPANTFVGKGVFTSDGSEWTTKSGVNRDGKGYYSVAASDFESNCNSAIATLKELGFKFDENTKKFTDFPSVKYLYNAGTGHQQIGEYIQSALAAFGITVTLEEQEWATFLNTRKDGNYSIARNGWLADYNDACSFIDMWTTTSGNNDAQFGR